MTEPTEDPTQRDSSKGLAILLPVLIHGVWRHKLLVALSFMIGAGIGVFRGLVTPNAYQSTGKLYVRPGVRDALAPDAVIAGSTTSRIHMGLREALQNEMQVLTTVELYDKIVAKVGVERVLAPYDPLRGQDGQKSSPLGLFHKFQSWYFSTSLMPSTELPVAPARLASLILAGGLRVEPEFGTNVIRFSYTSHSPELARQVVDAALESAKELHREIFDTMTSVQAMEEDAKTEEEAARVAEQRLRDFRVEKGIYDYEGRQKDLAEYLTSLHEQLDTLAIEIESTGAERRAVTAARENQTRERVRPGSDVAIENPRFTSLVAQQTQLEQELLRTALEPATMSAEMRETRIKKINDQLAKVRAELEQVDMRIYADPVKEEHPNYLRLSAEMVDLEIKLEGLNAQQKKLTAVRDENLAQLRELEKISPQLRQLEDDARQRRVKADRLAEGVANVRTVQRLDQLNLSDVNILHAATLPSTRISPQRGKMVVFSAFGGAALGLALAGLLTLRDRRIRLRQDVVRLGVPSDAMFVESVEKRPDKSSPLPESIASARRDIARLWATLPYERRSDDRLSIAVLACGADTDASRTAAALACGLAAHGGEDVVLLGGRDKGWLPRRLELSPAAGWSDVVRGSHSIEQVEVVTEIPNLTFIASGDVGASLPHPMATPGFAAVLEALMKRHRFVIIDLPDIAVEAASRAMLATVDAVQLVAQANTSTKDDVKQAITAVRTAGARLLGCSMRSRRAALKALA